MTTNWTKIAKPTSPSWVKISGGYHLYDDTMDTYDDSGVTYDGANRLSGWTKIPNATNGLATGGMYMGFGMQTYSGGQTLSAGVWTKIPKAT